MSADAFIQLLTVALAVLGIIWNQQRTVNKLRDDVFGAINKLRDDTFGAIDKLRDDVFGAIDKLRDDNGRDHEVLRSAIAQNGERITHLGERVARIEGRLGMDPPDSSVPEDDPP